MKPNNKSTLKEIKQYIIDNKLNQAPIRLTMNKPELVKKLKELGHYEEDKKEVKPKPKPKSKPKVKKEVKPKPKSKPKAKPKPPSKLDFMDALNVMTEVAKSKSKKTSKDIDEDVAISKKPVSYNKLYSILQDDDEFNEEEGESIQNIIEGYNLEFFIHKKLRLPNKDTYEELTDKQKDKLMDILDRTAKKEHHEFMEKNIYNKYIKGKKFSTKKKLIDTFMKHYKDR